MMKFKTCLNTWISNNYNNTTQVVLPYQKSFELIGIISH